MRQSGVIYSLFNPLVVCSDIMPIDLLGVTTVLALQFGGEVTAMLAKYFLDLHSISPSKSNKTHDSHALIIMEEEAGFEPATQNKITAFNVF